MHHHYADWGPYSDRLTGFAHVPDVAAGVRFDWSVFFGLYRRGAEPPVARADTGYLVEAATPDRHYVRYGQALPDDTRAQIAFLRHGPASALWSATIHNPGPTPVIAELHVVGARHAPTLTPYVFEAARAARVHMPRGGRWVDGMDVEVTAWHPDVSGTHAHRLPADGMSRGEVREHGLVDAQGLAGFTAAQVDLPAGDVVVRISSTATRYVRIAGNTGRCGPGFTTHRHAHTGGPMTIKTDDLTLVLDGVAWLPDGGAVDFEVPAEPTPQPTLGDDLQVRWGADAYRLTWDSAVGGKLRVFEGDDLATMFRDAAHKQFQQRFTGIGESVYVDTALRPLTVPAGGALRLTGRIDAGSASPSKIDTAAEIDAAAREADALWPESAGVGVRCLAGVLATNVLYPVRVRQRWTHQPAPGKWWRSVYTWDAGVIGLGLCELDTDQAFALLDTYLAQPDDDAAYLHHGSPLPIVLLLAQELWNRTRATDRLKPMFARMLRMHRFLVDDTADARGMLRTWGHFYNSGGWDDYPPQMHVQDHERTDTVTPTINTALAIRTAKLLAQLGQLLDEPTDGLHEDAQRLTDALHRHAWDEAEGFFSYVEELDDGTTRPLRHASGENFNRGLDGTSPLLANACTPDQRRRLIDTLNDPARFRSEAGLVTVDRTAAYARDDGYWNGSLWMPHQYLLWRALLDMGEGALAWWIASTALRVWDAEVRRSGCCFEHFEPTTGRGAGWHQFGGLSSIILNWHNAYHANATDTDAQPRITGGFDCWITSQRTTDQGIEADLHLTGQPTDHPTLLITHTPGTVTDIHCNGVTCPTTPRADALEINLPTATGQVRLTIVVSDFRAAASKDDR